MIPSRAHLIWIGGHFHWLHWAAVASAARRGGFQSVVLHHTHDLSENAWWRALQSEPGVTTRRIDALDTLASVGGSRLVDRCRELVTPAARSNVLRLALLARHGGVYLDTDTVTIRPLCELRAGAAFFCGAERIAFPAELRETWRPLPWAKAFARTAVRDLVRRADEGARVFQRIERYYPVCANNAILGSEAQHPFTISLLQRIVAMPHKQLRRRFALGTALLQRALAAERDPEVLVHPPHVFYPLGPELSEHWFRERSRARLDEIVSPGTRVVHWYASVRTRPWVPRIDPSWLTRSGRRPPLAHLLERALRPRSETFEPAAPPCELGAVA